MRRLLFLLFLLLGGPSAYAAPTDDGPNDGPNDGPDDDASMPGEYSGSSVVFANIPECLGAESNLAFSESAIFRN